ncbi:MAG: PilZ domain-containing protein [Phycisphaerae bacterium]|nr:PilZ domain-containing protein [Phycisphaerae bacterium]
MSSVCILDRAESRDLLHKAFQNRMPGILSYTCRNKWHVARVVLADLTEDRLQVETLPGPTGPQAVHIHVGQTVGISFKIAYGKFLFDATVETYQPPVDPSKGGRVVLACPDQMEAIQRRSYYRVTVPSSLTVPVVLWHRLGAPLLDGTGQKAAQGRLVDLSAGGAQVAIPCGPGDPDNGQRPDFKQGQYVGVRCTPFPSEAPLTFNAQIRNALPTADGSLLCMGLQLVGLEASPEGRRTLSRIAVIVDQYYRMNEMRGPGSAPAVQAVQTPSVQGQPQPTHTEPAVR